MQCLCLCKHCSVNETQLFLLRQSKESFSANFTKKLRQFQYWEEKLSYTIKSVWSSNTLLIKAVAILSNRTGLVIRKKWLFMATLLYFIIVTFVGLGSLIANFHVTNKREWMILQESAFIASPS